jgi:pyridoxamine 5'-phosphate oxidase
LERIERQVRIEGVVEKVSEQESDEYFNSRPASSRIGAWASHQSAIIEYRQVIEQNVQKYTEAFGVDNIPRPDHWGGYRVMPTLIEFWQGRSSRLHDRIQYRKVEQAWIKERLAP